MMNEYFLIPILCGLVAGVLVNYLSDVLPYTRKLSQPACLHCGQTFGVADYLFLRACGSCGRRRSARVWLTLLAVIGLNAYLWDITSTPLDYFLAAVILAYFALIVVIDIEHRLILHPTSLFGAALGLGVGWFKRGLLFTLVGGFAGFLIMFALYYLGVLFARYRARKMQQEGVEPDDEEALGFGDVALAGVLGLLLGWPLIWISLLQGILFAGVFGVLMVVFMLAARRYKENALMVFIPYGPFLILSAFLALFVRDWLMLIVPK